MTERAPTLLDALKPLAGRALEGALNRALALDPDTRAALHGLDGRRVALHLAAPELALQVRVAGERLEVGPLDDGAPDLAVRTSLAGLLAQLPALVARRLGTEQAPPIGQLRIEGDAELARRLQRLAERFDPDWQRPFAAAFGDTLGTQLAHTLAAGLRQAREAAGALATQAADHLTVRSRDVVAREELAAFHDAVDTLRDDVERLAARIARLRGSLAA